MGNDPKPAYLCEYHVTKASVEKRAAELKRRGYKAKVEPTGNYRGGGWLVMAELARQNTREYTPKRVNTRGREKE